MPAQRLNNSLHLHSMIARLSPLLLSACAVFAPQEPPDVSFEIQPIPREDRTDLRVTVSFVGDDAQSTRLALPEDRYGTPDMFRNVVDIDVEGATLSSRSEDGPGVVLVHEPGSEIRFTYLISLDPKSIEGLAFAPSLGPEHFHFFGSQWMLTFPDRSDDLTFRFGFKDVPEGWPVFSNFGTGAGPWELEANQSQVPGFIAGGDYVNSAGDGVDVHIQGVFENPETIARSVQEIVSGQRRFFDDFSQPFYVVSISARENISAGNALENSFICLTRPTSSQTSLENLIAHEAFHYWLPGKAKIVAETPTHADEYRFDWFAEGFAEYCGRRTLLESGRVTREEYAGFFNADLRELARNPMRAATLTEVARAIDEDAYTNRQERLNYVRGPLMALAWEWELEREGGETSVLSMVRAFVREGEKNGGHVTEAAFFAMFAEVGVDALSDYQSFIVDGETPVPPADALGPGFELEPITETTRGGEEIASWRFVAK